MTLKGSNLGPSVDIFAPGAGVVVAANSLNSAAGDLTRKSGTSFGSPFVAGIVAGIATWDKPLNAIDPESRLLQHSQNGLLDFSKLPGGDTVNHFANSGANLDEILLLPSLGASSPNPVLKCALGDAKARLVARQNDGTLWHATSKHPQANILASPPSLSQPCLVVVGDRSSGRWWWWWWWWICRWRTMSLAAVGHTAVGG